MTASMFAAASLASSSNSSSAASSPSILRPPSDLSSSVGSNRTLTLSRLFGLSVHRGQDLGTPNASIRVLSCIPRRPPIATSSAPPALNPTPIIPSLLFLGPAPSHPAHWAGLRALGVKRVLNVAEEVDLDVPTVHPGKGRRGGAGTAGEAEAEAEVKCRKVGIQDYVEEQPGEDMLRQGSEFLNESIHAQEPIYVHCLAGRSRSPTAIIAYLIR
ncbi:unnamed protein product [Tilletia laevis]|uniref:protein-tyrosine-phosphatase n=3 Tax=Tilletia TaxID=13289 RepID=A0A8X7MNE5_9BASI|nr:hypothetical protein CF336_g6076 [Tilletia laevis]KAE8191798.1 hypothetical protein CF328_g5568 [Tilletia controversa]KAE8255527.1 hypothetical protein A4X03_0g5551 [Tilletia caries]KAE8193823.1 hypothetical protein CF335_g5490 [Tilletia laevis]KAE8243030.1 hypothetical protein A4X06_0g6596 [Tilletia controversa]